ncbi:hypothetical protein [Candidatus Nitrosocosmicus sp. SS]|uniref:hypothetical protein n=1 Tax=Candidatus Nitrosocosmicus agrestis TaxID=2563600 RepID=UPI00122E9FCF|nr:hypothetical protein [Candidatus Nitrosocosmicus sp. SS]KAA2280316.1 hypothetical protein F1Z66_10995 [Candidatus Nitrosocosmicus sp. SS]KAF0867757.1 hypothetical protein E5N71_13780 [Candidatus Nitrosocosmicus sp. SS]MDR4491579.1 hypothetical protein [Candidatus Nitrosocosmicus sp.]
MKQIKRSNLGVTRLVKLAIYNSNSNNNLFDILISAGDLPFSNICTAFNSDRNRRIYFVLYPRNFEMFNGSSQ